MRWLLASVLLLGCGRLDFATRPDGGADGAIGDPPRACDTSVPPVPNGADPTVIWVATDGNDSNPGTQLAPVMSLGAAAGLVPPGGTIVMKAGVYGRQQIDSLPVSTNRPIVIRADSRGAVTLDGAGGVPEFRGVLDIINAADVIVDGFVITGGNQRGINIEFCTRCRVQMNTVEMVAGPGILVSGDDIVVDSNLVRTLPTEFAVGLMVNWFGVVSHNVTFSRNRFAGTIELAMSIASTDGAAVVDNQFDVQGNDALLRLDAVRNVAVERNVFYSIGLDPQPWGIYLTNIELDPIKRGQFNGISRDILIRNNLFAGVKGGIGHYCETRTSRPEDQSWRNVLVQHNTFAKVDTGYAMAAACPGAPPPENQVVSHNLFFMVGNNELGLVSQDANCFEPSGLGGQGPADRVGSCGLASGGATFASIAPAPMGLARNGPASGVAQDARCQPRGSMPTIGAVE